MSTKRLVAALTVFFCVAPAWAQHQGHDMHMAPAKKAPAKTAPAKKASSMDHSQMDHSQMDYSKMDYSKMDHSKMDHSKMDDAPGNTAGAPVPVPTEADLAAAFPPVHAHHLHGTSIQSYTLIDRFEVQHGDGVSRQAWEASGWIGGDVQKLTWRTEGHAHDGKVERASAELFYSRGIRPWWDVVAGVRHDFGQGPSRQWVGVGIQGLAPYKFEVNATLYVGDQSRTALRAGVEYDTLLTNRWILQWHAEANAYGKDDLSLGIGSGLSNIEAGARLRYEIDRKFAPYIGVDHDHAFGRTADVRKAAGGKVGDTRVVAGIRVWF
ncbi:copper resistance protein B [Lysobacter soyae]|uniref:Copper resistance protein B n=1 Tax=Lysobacter soyae TaxID=2764185 RepID=A0ABX8WT33_9GAMM|nr:copper resistance protein B [Lysobacter sp. CJ11]QYR53964.1 copper resistance protein B [Lysobacter sp. CJ11]